MQVYVSIDKEDEILQDIMSRVMGGKKEKDEFIKEAMYQWDYILHHTNQSSRHILLKSDIPLEPILDIDRSNERKFYNPDTQEIKRTVLKHRINIGENDEVMREILSRVRVSSDFAKEAILNWDYAVHNSYLRSRFLKLRDGFVKKKYYVFTEEQLKDLNKGHFDGIISTADSYEYTNNIKISDSTVTSDKILLEVQDEKVKSEIIENTPMIEELPIIEEILEDKQVINEYDEYDEYYEDDEDEEDEEDVDFAISYN